MAVQGGAYELRHIVYRQPVYVPAGDNAAAADAKRQQLEIKTSVKAQAKEAGIQVVEPAASKTLKATAAAHIDNALKREANEAAAQARLVSEEFLRLVKRTNVDEVTQNDIFRHHEWLRKNQCGDRTVANKHQRLASWLRFGGIDPKQIPPRPRYEEKLPDLYTTEQTRALLAAADPVMRMCILLGLNCGLRDQELQHIEFRDINWEAKTLRVRAKPQWKFTVKDWEQRDVPVPTDVLEAIKEWQEKRPGQSLILGTKNRKPNTRLLRMLKRAAKRAGLNCDRCDSCLERNGCEEFTLHKLRRTHRQSVKHFLDVLDELNRPNIELVSFRENIDTSGPLGRAIVVIIGAVAELERNPIIERVRAGMGRRRLESRQIGRSPVKVDHAAIQRDRQHGQSLRKIAKGRRVSAATVWRVLHGNPAQLPEKSA